MEVQEKNVLMKNGSMDYIKFGNGKRNLVIIIGVSMSGLKGLAKPVSEAYKVFTDEYTVYVFDRNENLYEGYTIADMASDIASAMKELNILNADVFGVSQGGMIAEVLAVRYPELVHAVVLGSTCCRAGKETNAVIENWVSFVDKKDYNGLNSDFFKKVYSEKFQKENKRLLAAMNVTASDEKYERFKILASACYDFDFYEEIVSIKRPAFVIGSKADMVIPEAYQQELAERIGCEIYMYEAYGHAVYDEAPDYKNRILNFLNRYI